VVVFGRSDATLNPGGVRIGASEIYNVIESMDEITDSLALGIPKDNDVEVILFVALKDEYLLDELLRKKILDKIKSELTPRHAPKQILQFKEAPVTLNGKKVEIAALKKILGEVILNESSLKNPESLKQFENLKL
jgi:acetoacetyl-CoA synthetase